MQRSPYLGLPYKTLKPIKEIKQLALLYRLDFVDHYSHAVPEGSMDYWIVEVRLQKFDFLLGYGQGHSRQNAKRSAYRNVIKTILEDRFLEVFLALHYRNC